MLGIIKPQPVYDYDDYDNGLYTAFGASMLLVDDRKSIWPTNSPTLLTSKSHIHHFNGHFPGKPGLAGCSLDSQSPVILSILTGQAETLHIR